MNTVQWKNNLYKNGGFAPSHSKAMLVEKARDVTPSRKQVEYRDALYKFCLENGLIRDIFKIRRTKQGVSANIRAFITILKRMDLQKNFLQETPGMRKHTIGGRKRVDIGGRKGIFEAGRKGRLAA